MGAASEMTSGALGLGRTGWWGYDDSPAGGRLLKLSRALVVFGGGEDGLSTAGAGASGWEAAMAT